MKINGQIMIHTIQDMVQSGLYKKAYMYVTDNDCVETEHKQTIACFRYLLGCVNGERYQPNQYSFTETPPIQPDGYDKLKYQMDTHCQGVLFEELRKLCTKFM